MTEPRKTPRTDEAIECGGRGIVSSASTLIETSRSLEIETQELAEALAEYANTDKQRVYHRSGIGTETAEGIRYARAIELIARHRAKQEAALCPKCNGVGRYVRVRNFDTEDADVWECQSPQCSSFGLLWHTPRPKDALGEMRCALLALIEAEKSSRDNFDSNSIARIEQAIQRAERVLFPERPAACVGIKVEGGE